MSEITAKETDNRIRTREYIAKAELERNIQCVLSELVSMKDYIEREIDVLQAIPRPEYPNIRQGYFYDDMSGSVNYLESFLKDVSRDAREAENNLRALREIREIRGDI
jgi:hypothetical protein